MRDQVGLRLKLFGVEFGTRSKGYVLTVTAGFGETGDTKPSTGVVVIELLKEKIGARHTS